MRLLIITQKVNKDDPILGFFHHWLIKFSTIAEQLKVLCLEKGEYSLPNNIEVFSLGKEKGPSRLKYLWNFFTFIWFQRNQYDAVFVHMNQEYVLLGGVFWRLWGKKIYLWRNHPNGNWLTLLAVALVNKVFCTSPQSYTARFKKTQLMPAGIDTDVFICRPEIERDPRAILYLGRISAIKKVEVLIEALSKIERKGIDFKAYIVGDPSKKGTFYHEELKRKASEKLSADKISFLPGVRPEETVSWYNRSGVFVNLTPAGSFDKTILEAMSCQTLVVVSNRFFYDILPYKEMVFEESSAESLAKSLTSVLGLETGEAGHCREILRDYVIKEQGLTQLTEILFESLK